MGSTPDAISGAPSPPSSMQRRHTGSLIHLGVIFLLFGATQVVYATFIVTVLVTEKGFGEHAAGLFWSVVGAFSLFSGWIFGRLSDRLGRKTGMVIVYILFTLSYVLAAADLPLPFLYLSIALFGLSMWSIPTIIYAAVGDYVPPGEAIKTVGFLTLFCGAGQVIGPAVAGVLADATGTFHMVFWLCAAVTLMAALLSAFLQSPSRKN